MSAPLRPESIPGTASEIRTRKSRGVVALLVFLTLANVATLVVVAAAWADATDHGDEGLVGMLVFSMITTLVALTGLGGAWATRKWGPRLYLGAVVVDRVAAFLALEQIIPIAMVGLVLAAILVGVSRDW